jgi:hypothetical protein
MHGEPVVHPAVRRALEALERVGIHWCLLRGEWDLASPEGDVDLLVPAGDLGRLRDALRPLGFVPVRAWGRGPHRFFVGYDEESRRRIKLDVVTDLVYGRYQELRTTAAEGCLARRRYLGTVAVLAPNDAFWTLLLHCLFDRHAFSASQRTRLFELSGAAAPDSELAGVVQDFLTGRSAPAAVLQLVRAENWPALAAIAREARADWPLRRRLVVRLRTLINRALRRASRALPSMSR